MHQAYKINVSDGMNVTRARMSHWQSKAERTHIRERPESINPYVLVRAAHLLFFRQFGSLKQLTERP